MKRLSPRETPEGREGPNSRQERASQVGPEPHQGGKLKKRGCGGRKAPVTSDL